MNTLDYCTTASLSIFFLIGCLIHLGENDVFSLMTIKKFQRLIYVLMSEIALDCLFSLLEGHEIQSAILYFIKSVELFLNPVLGFLAFDIFYDKKKKREDQQNKVMARIHLMMLSFIALNGVLLALAAVGQNVFIINEANLYVRGQLMPFYLLILGTMIATLVYGIILVSNNSQSTMKGTLFFFAASIVVGTMLRNILPKTNYDFLCMSVSIAFLLVYYAHITLRLDPLTRLLNRQVYNRLIERINYTTIVIMIDANNFKCVNDTHGHECGDRTLKKLARIICKTYGKHAYCFRLGGDEFCAILKPGAFEDLIEDVANYDAYILADKLTKELDSAISQAQKTHGNQIHLEYGVSQGYGIFYQQEIHSTISIDERRTLKEVIEIADSKMYESKIRFKERYSETTLID